MNGAAESEPADQLSSLPGAVILESKLHPPELHPDHVSRPRLLSLLDTAAGRRLTLVSAPAGFGKSTLLAEWYATLQPARRCAWVTLDEGENDPISFCTHLLHALHRAEPERIGAGLNSLCTPGVSLSRSAFPRVLNELWALDHPLALVLEDFHEVTNVECHEALRFFLQRVPPQVQVVIASRSDPPIGLAALRARGELCELRAADLRFTGDEAGSLLNDSLRLDLTPDELDRLQERTEGWAAGLCLAALSLRDRPDTRAFIDEFAGHHRHIVEYLGGDVLDRLPEDMRTFLMQTSLLESFTAALCAAVTGAADAGERLRTLRRTNLFVIPLDHRGEWYRYHHLFQDLLQVELERTQPDLLPALHGRAAAWYRAAGDANAAMRHALAARDYALAGDLFLAYAQPVLAGGRLATVVNWMDQLPDEVIATRPALALVVAWVTAADSRPETEMERWLAVAEASHYEGPFPLGEHSLRSAVALLRAVNIFENVGQTVRAAQAAVELETDPGTLAYLLAWGALGQALYLAGRPEEARAPLEAAIHAPLADRQAPTFIRATSLLALVCLELGETAQAESHARRALVLCEEKGFVAHPQVWFSYAALSTVLARRGRFDEAEALLTAGVEPHVLALRTWPLAHAQALLALASVRSARGHGAAAQSLLAEARAVIGGCPDPGMLPALLEETERGLSRVPRRVTGFREDLSESELRILRLLAGDLSQREIGRELYLSVNTVKTHTR